jgi:hypothetical protein
LAGVNQTDYRSVDKIVGIVLAAYSMCGVLCGGLIVGGGSLLAAVGVSQARTASAETSAPAAIGGGVLIAVGAVILAAYVLNIAGAIGVMKSQRWGFILTAILTGITALCSLSGSTGFTNTLPDVAACIYCILRLNGTWGPKPD